MIPGKEVRTPDTVIDDIFINRWSPRAMSGEPITQEALFTLLEAARWAPSSYNNQPWMFLYAHRDSEQWDPFFQCLVEFNQGWAKDAAVLLVLLSRKHFEFNNQPSRNHSFDAGAAWQNLALQGWQSGLVIHAMEGFDAERARQELHVPDEYHIDIMIAVGKPGKAESLAGALQEREAPSDRKPVSEFAFEGTFPA